MPNFQHIDRIIGELWAPPFPIISKKLISSNFGSSCHTVLINNKYVLKVPKNQRSDFQIKRESIVLEHLQQVGSSLIPKIIAKANTAEQNSSHWIIYKYIEGEVKLSPSTLEKKSAKDLLPSLLRSFQGHKSHENLSPNSFSYNRGNSLKCRAQITKELIEKAPLGPSEKTAYRVWEMALEATESSTHCQLIHGDLHPANLIFQNQSLCGVIDFGCSSFGDRSCDMMVAWTVLDNSDRECFFNALSATRQEICRARGWALTFGLGAAIDFPNSLIGRIGRKTLHNIFTEVD